MNKAMHIFLIWENGRKHEEKIINDIATKYDILQAFSIKWLPDEFANNLSRFYGKRLPKGCKKEKECGTGEFSVFICYDNKPKMMHDKRHPEEASNSNIIRDKSMYRKWCGGGYLVHASDNDKETNDNLLMLLGKNVNDICREYSLPWDGKKIQISGSTIGAHGWKNENELKKVIEKLSNVTLLSGPNRELVILTPDFASTSRLLNIKKRFNLFKKNQYMVVINGKNRTILFKNAYF